MSASAFMVFVTAGFSLFLLGLVVGILISESRNAGDESSRFGEAIKLWRNAVDKIDEMTRRNVVELGSVRERLTDMSRSMDDSRVVTSIGELAEHIRRLEEEVRGQSVQSETARRADALKYGPSETPSVDSRPVSQEIGTCDLDGSVYSFDDFVSEVAKKVELETPRNSLLDFVYDELRQFVPCQRMGYAEIDHDADRVSAVWHRSERPVRLKAGYSAALSKSSLQFVAGQNRPRTLNLHDYLHRHPNSHSTRLLVEEGFGSSLTFPVAVDDTVIGFFFLTSVEADGFDDDGITRVREVVTQISRAALFAQEASLV